MGRNERPTFRPSDRPSVRRTVRPTVVYALVVWIVDYVRELFAIRAQAPEHLPRNQKPSTSPCLALIAVAANADSAMSKV